MAKRKPQDYRRTSDLPYQILERTVNWVRERAFFNSVTLDGWEYRRARLVGPKSYEYIDRDWGHISPGEQWGGADVTAFFRKEIVIPDDYAGQEAVLDISLDGGEAQLSVNGMPWQGLDWHRSIVPLQAKAGDKLLLEIEAFVINYPYDAWRSDERDTHRFERAGLLSRDRLLESFYYDARFALDVYIDYWKKDENIELEDLILESLKAACNLIDIYENDREVTRKQVSQAAAILKERLYGSGAFRHTGRLSICGQSHLDVIYLWPVKETYRKSCRTTTNMLSLMREYPQFRFSQSQPFLYEKLKEHYPAVFAQIKEMVKEKRWEAIGGMYVEPDANMTGGEALIRQIMFGKRFLKEEFGVDTRTCWLPDVFGAVYTLPQILVKSGLPYFTTIKLNTWNDTNEFPYHTFWWQGPDGSRVLTHFPPTHFGEMFEPDIIKRHWSEYKQKRETGESLLMYGWADGGGGPTREMVEASLRLDGFPGMPGAEIEPAEDYFKRIEMKAENLPVWDDELYLEAHRGTYTTRGDIKKQNRQVETLYRDAEILSSLAFALGGPKRQEHLNEGWKRVLVNQFHDTLPGTHVPEAIADIEEDYETAFQIGREVRDRAIDYLKERIDSSPGICIINTLAWERDDIVSLPWEGEEIGTIETAGQRAPVQHYDSRIWFYLRGIPSIGWVTARATPQASAEKTGEFNGRELNSDFYRIEFTPEGNIKSIYDKTARREVLEGGSGNQFQVFEDNPGYKLNAWDILESFEDREWPVSFQGEWEVIANGPVFCIIRGHWEVLNSRIEQDIILYKDTAQIDFRTRVEWRDSQKLLKVCFPLSVRTRAATYDIPFGNIERPTHRNTSWEAAKFEVSAHKWADMSEGDYGVALLNDCKYGYDARENRLRLTLIKSPVRPNPASDTGRHEFNYSLLPHSGQWREAGIDRAGYQFNIPVIAVVCSEQTEATLPDRFSLLEPDARNVIVETVKQAEEGDRLVVRLFDNRGCRGDVKLRSGIGIDKAEETNLLEEFQSEIALDGSGEVNLSIRPYEIKTVALSCSETVARSGNPRRLGVLSTRSVEK